ncbi:succinyl-diaminopimelate desuccinylase [Candidatus Portiera aleyrodidarum]|uniref:Succinyl-diaminopimelate desuccinylase n=1 Tax=Candidatus Portiera aleyrodidarum MED (Bemisia tabaci) TaxID=1163752 RepID=A0AAU8RZ58_9GAMM|nr:succinyl-diaminopimelate desuccinylase [Candidatus Portiera aleyrodidarum]AFS18903.1 Succinyl-diaminopimelate desuccinylase [Candidatus Portiera aleyrodidarum BT-QVLC]AFT80537.1 Succinyl-diaminopimelate desuccinylase [Candidatus Portiera aleyrodidarum BT-QVLC]AJF24116.1 succinyl-diaminopimelate desuccinylase [Candidatus Portiera aleyrodidarum MED (Bemisia tabaci)]
MYYLLKLVLNLLSKNSITPNDKGCQYLLSNIFKRLCFRVEVFNKKGVHNLWVTNGFCKKTLLFVGHTDVVPSGPIKAWEINPFLPYLNNRGYIISRGIVDMKGSLCSMIKATCNFIKLYPKSKEKIAFLITSDEEGDGNYGTKYVINKLIKRNEIINYCIIGEPTSKSNTGDTLKIGRRGSLNAKIIIYGIQGHIAYTKQLLNPIHILINIIHYLLKIRWDKGNKYFSKTSFQISNFIAGLGVSNMLPKYAKVLCNFRFSNELTVNKIKTKVSNIFLLFNLNKKKDFKINWYLSGEPYLTKKGTLLNAVIFGINYMCKIQPKKNTNGGISDGRFVKNLCKQIIELGLINATIHKINECVCVSDIILLTKLYQLIIEYLFIYKLK